MGADESNSTTGPQPKSPAQEAADQCDRIIGMCDEMPERAEDFTDSVREKTESILAWIEENDHVTEAQQAALDNMEDGVSAWLNR